MRVRKLLASHSGTVFASAFPADGAKRSGRALDADTFRSRLSLFHRRAGMASPARQPNTWVASMTSRDGYIWFAVALAIAIVVLACIAIWTGSAPT